MAIGKVGSFATDKPVEDTIGNAMKYTEQMGFKYREEEEKKKALKKAEDDAKLKDYAEWDGKFDPKIIGNSSIDDPLIGMAMKAKQRAADISRELYTTTDFNKKASLMSERNKLAQSFDIANQTPVLIKQKVKDLQEGIEKGKYNPRDVDFIEKIAKNLETGKYELDYNDRGVASVKIYDTDETGKPTGVLKETALGDLVNAFQPKLAFSYEKYKDETLKNVKPDEFGSQKGAVVVSGKRISPKNIEQSKTYADVIINDPNKLYEAQFLFKENDPEKLRIALEKDFLTSIPEGKTQTLDSGILNYGLAKRKQDKEEQVAQIEVVETPPIYAEAGVTPMNGYKTVSVVGGQPIQQIIAFDKSGKPIKMDTAFLNSYTVTKNPRTGERAIVAEITYPDYKSAGYTKEEQMKFVSDMKDVKNKEEADLILSKATKPISYKTKVAYLTEKDASKYLKVGNFKSVNEMKDKARVSEEAEQSSTQDDFNAKWAKLKPGESLVGPDGKTYKKK